MRKKVSSETRQTHRPGALPVIFTLTLSIIYVLIASEKPVAIYSLLGDEPLFLKLGMNIASGQWLGEYNCTTLVKGAGYPLFLFTNYMTGLSVGIGQLTLYLAASIYFARTLSRICGSSLIYFLILPMLLATPALFSQELQRLLRDSFYCSLTLLYLSTLLDLLLLEKTPQKRLIKAGLTGVFVGFLWITREEGLWILPATGFLLLSCLVKTRKSQADRSILGYSLITATTCALVIIGAVATTNKYFYGSFVINEIKGGSFPSALVALQKASAPYWRPYIPVPKEARLRIYAQSPTFAKLKSYLDPEEKESPWNYGCSMNKSFCGEIVGGWFMWAFIAGANSTGACNSQKTAEHFYHQVADEVDMACAEGRLSCSRWLPPLVPYMNIDQIMTLPTRVVQALRFVSMLHPMSFEPLPSQINETTREDVIAFLNNPVHVDTAKGVPFTLSGWYRGDGDEWISVSGSGVSTPLALSRIDKQRFIISGSCNGRDACSLRFVNQHGKTVDVGPRELTGPGEYLLGDGQLHLDKTEWLGANTRTLRTRLYESWTVLLSFAQRYYSALIIAGGLAFMIAIFQAIYRRRMSTCLIAASTIAIAVLCRVGLIALIDASSFPAMNYSYLMPAIPLAIGGAVLSILELGRTLLPVRASEARA